MEFPDVFGSVISGGGGGQRGGGNKKKVYFIAAAAVSELSLVGLLHVFRRENQQQQRFINIPQAR